ncbi:hypothetical protein GKJPGBOP_02180 [Streptomyces paromomycinus]|uniref:Uncharacterized protein n=1 Tax=Streptomyces paromomycinus TaxID=92743 RepID=A0A401VZN8_STREY|nr:hypothetical protein GKJPGBOP_02180 [Streptomyces paromomycinus]
MTFGFDRPPDVSLPTSADSAARLSRMLEPSEWASAGIPLLRNPREVVTGLHDRHLPGLWTAVVAVLGPEERVVASASFVQHATAPDGWEFRNALLTQLRQVVPHDLRLRAPVRTAVLLYCREGDPRWTEADGAWMWGLRDACTLHGLRCGAYITLTRGGWQVLGEGRGGRRPRSVTRPAHLRGTGQPQHPYVPESHGPAQRRTASEQGPPKDSEQAEDAVPPEASGRIDGTRRSGPPPSPPGSPERNAPVERTRSAERTRTPGPQPYAGEPRPPAEPPHSDGRRTPRRGTAGALEARRRAAAR